MFVYWLLLLGPTVVTSFEQRVLFSHAESPTYVAHAKSAVNSLQQWYNNTSGLWDTTGWWNSANALTMLADFVAVDSSIDHIAMHVFRNTFVEAQKSNPDIYKVMTTHLISTYIGPHLPPVYTQSPVVAANGFLNAYYDDEGWWALAWLKVYDHVNQTKYLQAAMDIFDDMTKGWGATCGGLWWSKDHTYTGAIENELFLTVAAQLANRVPEHRKPYYLDWALREWDWFQGSGMINAQLNINNGLDLVTCQNDNGTVWSYNQGVILGGLIELSLATGDKFHLKMAEEIAFAAIKALSDLDGILHDQCEPDCGADGSQFKGIFMRNLQTLQHALPNARFKTFIDQNADSIWLNDREYDNLLGIIWSGPFTGATASTQSSACDALVAAMAGEVTRKKLVPFPGQQGDD
ncbi:hypothetical protein MMC28_004723 [Mycoblastus sanguinarius]|nr:hypothetical protein [Mycoblastus sanguinarius]